MSENLNGLSEKVVACLISTGAPWRKELLLELKMTSCGRRFSEYSLNNLLVPTECFKCALSVIWVRSECTQGVWKPVYICKGHPNSLPIYIITFLATAIFLCCISLFVAGLAMLNMKRKHKQSKMTRTANKCHCSRHLEDGNSM